MKYHDNGKGAEVNGDDDNLDDVTLAGVSLVTSNWHDWLVPQEAERFDSIYDWWTYLHERELRLPPRAAEYVKELVDVCPTLRWRPDGTRRRGSRSRALLMTEKLLELGFTIEQLEQVTGLTGDQMLGADLHGAWRKIVNGATASQVHADHPNLRLVDLRRFYNMANGVSIKRDHPAEWRQELFDLMDDGLGVTAAAKVLSERHGTEIKYHTAYAWVKRYRNSERQAS